MFELSMIFHDAAYLLSCGEMNWICIKKEKNLGLNDILLAINYIHMLLYNVIVEFDSKQNVCFY